MDNTTLEALNESIKHWEENRDAEQHGAVATGIKACALCGLFREVDCKGCPVENKTKQMGCINTPYYAALEAKDDWEWADEDESRKAETFRDAAQAEVDFLKSLLPE